MIFYGWGKNSKTLDTGPSEALVLVYQYMHIFWLFRVSFGHKYSLATLTDTGWMTAPLTRADVKLTGAKSALQLHWWWRFGLFVPLGLIAVLAIAGSLL